MIRSLHSKFFVWFLLVFGATAGTTALVTSLLADERWGKRGRDILFAEARTACALIEHGSLHERRDLDLEPLTERFFTDRHASGILFDRQGELRGAWLYERSLDELEPLLRPLVARTIAYGQVFESAPKQPPMAAIPCANGVLTIIGERFTPPARTPLQTITPVAVIVLITWLASWPLARYLSQPLRALTQSAERLARGDFSLRPVSRRSDEIGRLTQAFNAMADGVSNWLEAKQRLLGDVAHELKTPLSRQKVALELLRMDADLRAQPQLDRLTRDTDAIAELVDELLDYARADARFALNRTPIDVEKVVHEVLELRPDNAEPVTVHKSGAEPVLSADRRVLHRALSNLIDNATRHGKTGISVDIHTEEAWLTVSVRDHGPGVPEDQLKNIFEPFVRLDDSRNRKTGGTGLGLAIAQRGVLSHGGTISASLPEGGGLQIDLRLPVPG